MAGKQQTLTPIEHDLASAEREISSAWNDCEKLEKYGLEFGRVCYEWQQKLRAQGSRTGGGLRPILDKVGIPKSTAYWWIGRYMESEGLRGNRTTRQHHLRRSVDEPAETVHCPQGRSPAAFLDELLWRGIKKYAIDV